MGVSPGEEPDLGSYLTEVQQLGKARWSVVRIRLLSLLDPQVS